MKKESKLYSGTICITDLMEKLKSGHSAFVKVASNGKIYCNILLWENAELDKYNNSHSIQLNSKKELKDQEGKVYIGNVKPIERKTSQQSTVSNSDIANMLPNDTDLPF